MSITITETLTIEEYIEVFPQDSAVEEDIIQGAINNATITLDTICGGMITKVWAVIDPTDPLYRTDDEHNYIKQAVAKQTQYLVSKNLDMSAGSESYTSGSNSYNETRPRPELVVDETIYQLLAQARVYNPNITTDTTIAKNNIDDFYNPSYDPSQQYITLQLGDNRYIKKASDYTEKFLYSNTDGNIEYVDIKLSPTGTSSATANFMTINGVEWALGGGSSAMPYWGNIQGKIQDQTDLYTILTQLEDYCDNLDATKAAADSVYTKYLGEEGTETSTSYNVQEVNTLIGTTGGTYLGSAQGTGTDVASDEAASKFIGDYLGVSTAITKNSYFNITIATNDVWNEDIYRYIATGNKITIEGTEYYEYKFGFKFTGDLSLLKQDVETLKTSTAKLDERNIYSQENRFNTTSQYVAIRNGCISFVKNNTYEDSFIFYYDIYNNLLQLNHMLNNASDYTLTFPQKTGTLATTDDIVSAIYPVGAIYISTSSTDPSTLFSGTSWEALPQNCYLMCGSYTGTTTNSNTKQITVSQIPAHSHSVYSCAADDDGVAGLNYSTCKAGLGGVGGNKTTGAGYFSTDYVGHQVIANTGGSEYFNVQPLTLAVYMWRRTA